MTTQNQFTTKFASLKDYTVGDFENIDANPKHYVYSNIFDVAAKSKPWEKVVVGKNLRYVIEAIRAEGESPWYTVAHDEFAVVMDGEVTIQFVKPEKPILDDDKDGAVLLEAKPAGQKMGYVKLKRGHQALLPAGSAYQISAPDVGVIFLQSCKGDLSIERWDEITHHH